ncbi:P-loop containing nucleoside triphosphate hydrolase protein [Pluteus cervinus]|uniref:P-loop containing nucleoside triphosphate hydrolase protein n=1 Tax=Pluteus cervinus TaxID=181527 RepID=A0ACD3BFF0_9AGAR|nr:P-loop containing nucleoside triphosphate hydrolase protein [Pluteus cervinus]
MFPRAAQSIEYTLPYAQDEYDNISSQPSFYDQSSYFDEYDVPEQPAHESVVHPLSYSYEVPQYDAFLSESGNFPEEGHYMHEDIHERPSKSSYSYLTGNSTDFSCEDDDTGGMQIVRATAPQTGGSSLRPVSELPDVYRGLFKFGVFNAVQSVCFDSVIGSEENLVLSAPTGSGKTVIFELAIVRLLTSHGPVANGKKCVYIAPTKALCSEKFRDWSLKFEPLGIKCCELTGDTVKFGRNVWGDAKKATVIITTAEKWDSLTRNWQDHNQILSQIQLFMVDEIHVINDSRGSTLEVIVSRMKTRGSAVRFIVVSATVPNIRDVAEWIGSHSSPNYAAQIFEFGDEYRPCKLTRHVIGVPRKGANEFAFPRMLDSRLFPSLQTYSTGKPILIFCATRKGVIGTAEHLKKAYEEAEARLDRLPWKRPQMTVHNFYDKRISDLATIGIGIHHAGMILDDRRLVEDLYLQKQLQVVVSTSTLATGVNLPAHMVVIKGVHTFQNNQTVEYSDLDIIQMLGRAGRPQFDKDGVALILCETELQGKYEAMAQGSTILESNLHRNLFEHLNSEIGLGTISSATTATKWLRGSFLFQRIKQNPQHYSLNKEDNQSWEERVDELVENNLTLLKDANFIEPVKGTEDLQATEYGEIMSKFYIRYGTMNTIMALSDKPSMKEILEAISRAEEVCGTSLRSSEKQIFNKLRRHNDIRFEIARVEKPSDKVFLLVQAILGGISLSAPEYRSGDCQLQLEALSIFRHIVRIARAVIEVAIAKQKGAQLKYGLELLRCLSAKAWEDRPVVLRQVEQIGEKSLKVLAEHGVTSLRSLRAKDQAWLETVLNRRSPFGLEILTSAHQIPDYSLKIDEIHVTPSTNGNPVTIELSVGCALQARETREQKKVRDAGMTTILTLNSDLDLLDFRRIPTKALRDAKTFELFAQLSKPSQSIIVHISSETIAGNSVTQIYRPVHPASIFPVPDTRPPDSMAFDLDGLEDDPTFWDMKLDTDSPTRDNDAPDPVSVTSPLKHKAGVLKISGPRVDLPGNHGRYPCGHTCKDKMKCRHLCCREGLAAPAKKRSDKKTASPNPSSQSDKQPGQCIRALEALHNTNKVTSNLEMTAGQRLKIAPTVPRRKPANFDIDFVDLSDKKRDSFPLFDIALDDDLPETGELFRNSGTNTSKPSKPEASDDTPDTRDKTSQYAIATKRTRDKTHGKTNIWNDATPSPKRKKLDVSPKTSPPNWERNVTLDSFIVEDAPRYLEQPIGDRTPHDEVFEDEFADLDKFLASGAVDLV